MVHRLWPALLLLAGCSLLPDPRPGDRVVVASWNVENLFDDAADGGEYPEFDPRRGWTRAQFWARCEALAPVIRGLCPGGPDVLVLEEVENARTAEVLNGRFLAGLGYRYTVMAPPQTGGVKTVILARYRPLRTGLFYPSGDDAEPLRPLVEAEFDLGGRSLVVIGNHWKSRIPTPAGTEGLRRASAGVLRRRLEALEARADRPLAVAAGDFNTSPELSRSRPDRAMAAASSEDPGALLVFSSLDAARKAPRPGAVYDPWDRETAVPGSYVYRGDWDRLDHLFVAAGALNGSGWTVESFRAAAYAPEPRPYGPARPDGVSDHFPVVLTLSRGP